jgi:hypothetical protein
MHREHVHKQRREQLSASEKRPSSPAKEFLHRLRWVAFERDVWRVVPASQFPTQRFPQVDQRWLVDDADDVDDEDLEGESDGQDRLRLVAFGRTIGTASWEDCAAEEEEVERLRTKRSDGDGKWEGMVRWIRDFVFDEVWGPVRPDREESESRSQGN